MSSLQTRVAGAAAVALLALSGCAKQEPAPDPVRAVRTMTVASASAAASIDYAADVRARTESRLSFRVGGKLVERTVNLGDRVKAGQVLARLDPQDLRLGQDSARAAQAAAQANLDLAQADFARYKELREQGFISSAELERRETTLKAARAQLQQAQAQSAVQLNQTGYAALVADVSGVVTGIDAEPGTVLAAGTPVLRLAHDGPRDAVFAVPEDKVELMRSLAGGAGNFSVIPWGDAATPLPATLREVSAAADPVTRTFLLKADVGAAAPLRLGQTVTVHVDLPSTPGITKLPLSALKEEQGRHTVWVVDRGSLTVKPQAVQIAGADGNEAVVTAGLSPGQIVVTAGVHVLTSGQKVKLYGAAPATLSPAASAASR
ncbi:MAG: efflux RND transporter periplasmic adaptor subunit [Ideonella sp.]|nr:efflux RND transporter periplasmic adaptor subunit [Ideonella sp.]